MTFSLKFAFLFLVSSIFASCGETKTLKRRGKFASKLGDGANAQKSIISESSAAEEDLACAGATTTSLALVDFVAENLEGKIGVLAGGKSLCDVLSEGQTPVALFQIVKTDCEACREQVENVSLAIAGSAYADGINHVIIETDDPDSAALSEFKAFTDESAASAELIKDDAKKAWTAYASDKTDFKNPTIIVMAMSSKGIIFNDSADTYLNSISAAEELIQAEVSTFETTTPTGDGATTLEWDGLANIGTSIFEIITIR